MQQVWVVDLQNVVHGLQDLLVPSHTRLQVTAPPVVLRAHERREGAEAGGSEPWPGGGRAGRAQTQQGQHSKAVGGQHTRCVRAAHAGGASRALHLRHGVEHVDVMQRLLARVGHSQLQRALQQRLALQGVLCLQGRVRA